VSEHWNSDLDRTWQWDGDENWDDEARRDAFVLRASGRGRDRHYTILEMF